MSEENGNIFAGMQIGPDFWLRSAQAVVRRFCGWHIAPNITETLHLDGHGGRGLELPTTHMTGLGAVSADGVDVSGDVAWSHTGVLWLKRGLWPDLPGAVEVEFSHGFAPDEVPDVQAVIATLAKRAAATPGNVSSQSVNGASVSFLAASGAPLSVPLLALEKETLAPYRFGWLPR